MTETRDGGGGGVPGRSLGPCKGRRDGAGLGGGGGVFCQAEDGRRELGRARGLGDVYKRQGLHRAIDTYTDAHPIFRESTNRLNGKFHHYSGVIVDVFYDHFLPKNWNKYSDEELVVF